MDTTQSLRVLLNDLPIGVLSLDRNERTEFRFLDSYKRGYPQPILGQTFMDDLDLVHFSRARVPPWFSNLLPEGPLREFLSDQAGISPSREFHLLQHLGENLPGAVRIIGDQSEYQHDDPRLVQADKLNEQDRWRFSLAGVQLKFSASRGDRGLTVPVSSQGGDWIVKLPDSRFPNVPANEYATMQWARASGIPIPDIELVEIKTISGIADFDLTIPEQYALAIRRFDRTSSGPRIHIEDFAQVLNLYPGQKYKKYNYETIARLILELVGTNGLDDFIRRHIFNIASGNGDAHHKNWSLIYRDGITASLSPAYDLVSTIQYIENDSLALNFAKSKRWEDIRLTSFKRLARKLQLDEASVVESAQSATEAIHTAWRNGRGNFGYSNDARRVINDHFRKIPLLNL